MKINVYVIDRTDHEKRIVGSPLDVPMTFYRLQKVSAVGWLKIIYRGILRGEDFYWLIMMMYLRLLHFISEKKVSKIIPNINISNIFTNLI